MINIQLTDKELLAIKAVTYGCLKNTRLRAGDGMFVEDIHNYKEENTIYFDDAIIVVNELLDKIAVQGTQSATIFEEFEVLVAQKDIPITITALLETKEYADFKKKWVKL